MIDDQYLRWYSNLELILNMNPAKKILVVDDDPDLLEIASYKLTGAGYIVLKAKNGKEGLEAALSQHPDLILLDVMMPQVTGLEMLKSLREDPWGKQAQVFMLTSMDRSKEMSEGMHYNVAKYIIKANMKYEDLLADIKTFLQ
jgi:two-component system alkaline phosphatase synthesis response regulator PhoP